MISGPLRYISTTVTAHTENSSTFHHKIDCKVCLDKTLPAYPSCPSSLVRLECPENQNKRAQWVGKTGQERGTEECEEEGKKEEKEEKKDIKTFDEEQATHSAVAENCRGNAGCKLFNITSIMED